MAESVKPDSRRIWQCLFRDAEVTGMPLIYATIRWSGSMS